MIKELLTDCAHDTVSRDSGQCVDCGALVSDGFDAATESEDPLSDDERTGALLVAAIRDARLTLLERSAAAHEAERVGACARLIPGWVEYGGLTDAGREAVRVRLPEPQPAHWLHAASDVLRRLRGAGHTCSDVRVETTSYEGRAGYRVSWEGDGWEWLSRRSHRPEAAQNRGELEQAARVMGLEIVAEAGPTLLVVEPEEEEIVIRQETVRKIVTQRAVEATPMEQAIARLDAAERADADVVRRAREERRAFLAQHRVTDAADLPDALYAEYVERFISAAE